MILADTSIWIHHFKSQNIEFSRNLKNASILIHPFIIGELACGSLKDREQTLSWLKRLEAIEILDHEEILFYIEKYKLSSKGLGYVDMHLLAAAKYTGVPLWTKDKRLNEAAKALNISYK